MSMEDQLKDCGKKMGEVLATLGKNYIASIVANGLKPVFVDAVMSCLDDAKNDAGMGGPPAPADPLGGDMKGAEQPDLFDMTLDSCSVVSSGWSYSFTAYTIFCIRIGTDKDGKFFALGKMYQVGYGILKDMWSALKKENDKNPPAALPPDCKHGNYCFCLKHKNDMPGHESVMKEYFNSIVAKYPSSKAVPSFYYMGDNYEQQQRMYAIFTEAFNATKDEVMKGDWSGEGLSPFNEGEAVNQLLRAVARRDFVPKFRALSPNVPIECIQIQLWYAADSACLGAVDGAVAAGWPPIQKGVDVAKGKVAEAIDKGAAMLVSKLKPVIAKILAIVQEKLKKKGEEKEQPKPKDKGPQIGDSINKWQFQRSEIGKKFWEALNQHDARQALKDLGDNSESALESFLQAKMASGVKSMLGEDTASMEIVQLILEVVAEQIVKTLKKFTTLKPLMRGMEKFFDKRLDLEKELIGARAQGAEAINKALDHGSSELWKTMPSIGLRLFIDMHRVKGEIANTMSGVCDDGVQPLKDVADDLYALQMKAINSLRVQLINQLKAKLPAMSSSDEQVKECVRSTWRELSFQVTHVMVKEAWIKLAGAFTQSCIAQVKDKFNKDIWPTIKSALDALQSMLPSEVSDMGLDIAGLALKVVSILLEKGVTFGMTKLLLKVEVVVFSQ